MSDLEPRDLTWAPPIVDAAAHKRAPEDLLNPARAWLEAAWAANREEPPAPEPFLHELNELRRATPKSVWDEHVVPMIRAHPIYNLALECPFSARATQKPRGYAGDALLLDFFYQRPSVWPLIEAASARGRYLCDFWSSSPAARAVRARRDYLKKKLEALAMDHPEPRVMAVACGHLIEAIDNPAAQQGRFRDYVAFDQDATSLGHIERYGQFPGLRLVKGKVTSLLAPPAPNEGYDLIYAAGLYDYLPQALGRQLVESLFARLLPGGQLIIGNFLPSTPNIAAMEVFQDWYLIYRTEAEIQGLAGCLDRRLVARQEYATDPDRCIGLFTLTRGS